ncbi:MAG: tetratricopeptide repeat protein [Flavobacteriales bacterium]
MNKIMLSLAGVTLLNVAMAQNAKVVNAFNYLRNYTEYKDLDALAKAQVNIDEASANPSTSAKAKTWYYRGNVYWAINESKNEVHKGLSANPLEEAVKSYAKVVEIEPKGQFTDDSKVKILQASNILLNNGVEAFTKEDFAKALQLFENAVNFKSLLGITDTVGINNSALAAYSGKNFDKAIIHYQRLLSFNTEKNGNNFIALSKAFKEKGDKDNAIKTLQAGRAKFPDDANLITEELNFYLVGGQTNEAEAMLRLAIEKDPKNSVLYFAAGTIYDKLGNREAVISNYKKAIEINPDYYDAYYNLGAFLFNEGKVLQDKANEEKDLKKYEAGKKLADAKFAEALPYLERAVELRPDEMDIANILLQLYGRLNMDEKFMELKKKIKK